MVRSLNVSSVATRHHTLTVYSVTASAFVPGIVTYFVCVNRRSVVSKRKKRILAFYRIMCERFTDEEARYIIKQMIAHREKRHARRKISTV
jgi:hypothetical protein